MLAGHQDTADGSMLQDAEPPEEDKQRTAGVTHKQPKGHRTAEEGEGPLPWKPSVTHFPWRPCCGNPAFHHGLLLEATRAHFEGETAFAALPIPAPVFQRQRRPFQQLVFEHSLDPIPDPSGRSNVTKWHCKCLDSSSILADAGQNMDRAMGAEGRATFVGGGGECVKKKSQTHQGLYQAPGKQRKGRKREVESDNELIL